MSGFGNGAKGGGMPMQQQNPFGGIARNRSSQSMFGNGLSGAPVPSGENAMAPPISQMNIPQGGFNWQATGNSAVPPTGGTMMDQISQSKAFQPGQSGGMSAAVMPQRQMMPGGAKGGMPQGGKGGGKSGGGAMQSQNPWGRIMRPGSY